MAALTFEQVVEQYPEVRQSELAAFDNCALESLWETKHGKGWSTHPQAAGTIFHAFAAEALRTMQRQSETKMPVDVGLALMYEALLQQDVPVEDYVRVPMRDIKDLKVAVIKWCHDNVWDIHNLIDVEKRLRAELYYPDMETGEARPRILTGQLDALFADASDVTHAIVLDWKNDQPLDARILTPSGWTTMGALKVGDSITGADGTPTKVIGVYPQGVREVFEVEFTDGSKTEAGAGHLWQVARPGGVGARVMTTAEIAADVQAFERRHYWQVPAVAPVRFDVDGDRPLDAYLLGALLGDGDLPRDSSIGFTTADIEMIDILTPVLPTGITLHHSRGYNWRLPFDSRVEPNPLIKALDSMGLLGTKGPEKFIPDAYLFAPEEERLSLLQGLMDTDGFVSEQNQTSFSSSSRVLAEQVQFLVRSLGGRATIKTWPKPGYLDSHCVYLRLPVAPFRLSRKLARWSPPSLTTGRGIRRITSVGQKPTQCIEVEAEDSLYVTDELIVTHNTWGLPPKQDEDADQDKQTRGLSYLGYFQQRFYGWLILRTYQHIQRVTLREYYPRYSEVRDASLTRADLEEIEQELGTLCAARDRSLAHGLKRSKFWLPSPGKHCTWCLRPGQCPIEDEAKGEGAIRNPAQAKKYAGELVVAERVRDHRKEALKAYSDVHGPVEVKSAKGRREIGHVKRVTKHRPTQEQVEEAMRQGVDPTTLYKEKVGTVHTQYTPEGSDRAADVDDKKLMQAMKDSAKIERKKRS